jgi:hypothetical protein
VRDPRAPKQAGEAAYRLVEPCLCKELCNRLFRMWRVGSVQDRVELALHLIGGCSAHAPALGPGPEQQRLASLGIVIACQNKWRLRLQPARDRTEQCLLYRIARHMMQYTDQGRRIELIIRRQIVDVAEMDVRTIGKPVFM